MGRRESKGSGLARQVVTWVVIGALLSWGIGQFVAVRRTILADIEARSTAEAAQTATAPAESGSLRGAEGTLPPAAEPEGPAAAEVIEEPAPATTQAAVDRGRQLDELCQEAEAALDAGDLVTHRQKLNEALPLVDDPNRAAEIREALSALNTGVFLGPDLLADDSYAPLAEVIAGDSYVRLARRYKVPAELLEAINPQVPARSLRPGSGIKVIYGPFHARVLKQEGRLDLYVRDLFVRSYPVHFEEGNYLPKGLYRVKLGGKIRVSSPGGARLWIEIQGVDSGTRELDRAWLYGSAGTRGPAANGNLSGVRLDDAALAQVFQVLFEQESFVRVDP